MMLGKRVPVIVPLHEIAKPESTPARDAKPSLPHHAPTLQTEDLAVPIMRPLRKNKRLRPAIVPITPSEHPAPQTPVRETPVAPVESMLETRSAPKSKRAKQADVVEVVTPEVVEASNTPDAPQRSNVLKRSSAAQRRNDRESSSIGSDSRGSSIQSPLSSAANVSDDLSTEALMKFTGVAQQVGIVWTKIKGHPFWPAQYVRMSPEIMADERFKNAAKFKRKVDDTCVMYFGTCEIAYVNKGKSCIPWNEGLNRNMHRSHRGRNMFQRALLEVKAFCQRNTKYPRGWWCEPKCMALAADFYQYCVDPNSQSRMKPFIKVAETELVFWAKIRGYPQWPVQVLPRNMACERYPELKLTPDNMNTSSVPCMFFGTGEVAMIADKNRTPFGAGLARGYGTASDRRDFVVATGEMWGYLQTPRTWPSGYLSGVHWWNYEESAEAAEKDGDSEEVRVPHMPVYEHIKRSVCVEGVELPAKPKPSEVVCCSCKMKGKEAGCLDTRCLNFASRFLCDPTVCPAGKQCANLPFRSRKIPKVKPFFTADQRGWGLRVEEPLKNGRFVIEYVGEIINREILEERLRQAQREKNNEYYMMDLTNDLIVDAKFKGNFSRFINSSCEPNCATQKWIDPTTGQTHVGIFAIQDIEQGTELTYNYCFEDYGLTGKSGKRSFMCQCGTSSCCMLEPIEQQLMKKLVGKRLEVRWDDGWYPGVVELYDFKKKRFRVQYDDGDCEDLVLGLPLDEDDGVAFRLVEDEAAS